MNRDPKGARRPGRHHRITSLTNPQVKFIRSLYQKKYRDRAQLFPVEGLQLVRYGLDAGWTIELLLYEGTDAIPATLELAAACRAQGADILDVSRPVLAKIARRDNPQAVMGIFRQEWRPLQEVGQSGVWIALESIRDPGNLGTILRTADASGAEGLVLLGDCCDPYSWEATRASMGSIFHVPPVQSSVNAFVDHLCTLQTLTIGTQLDADEDYRSAAYNEPCIVAMGNEQRGISADLAAACATLVRIPMTGRAESLNLAVASGLMLYEARRKQL